jgi:tetratricopeptide (TPR) repeat protein
VGTREQGKRIAVLFDLLDREGNSPESQCTLIQKIADEYIQQEAFGILINFLTARIDADPGDPYNGYYLLMTAYAYTRQEAWQVAALYFDRILKNYNDLSVQGQSIHLVCLKELITLVEDPVQRAWYYEELISRFPDRIDLGLASFNLAQAYEQTGEWYHAIAAYTQFLPHSDTPIPGFADAYTYAKQLVDFNNSPKDWTFESLAALVEAIKKALDQGTSSRLWSYRAKVNFFARSWEQEGEDDSAGMGDFNLSDFMRGNRIHYAASLDAGSNANEAYLRTSGWSQYISTWYFFFRKIYFPPDPEIHGRWEWAGVYYGEKF